MLAARRLGTTRADRQPSAAIRLRAAFPGRRRRLGLRRRLAGGVAIRVLLSVVAVVLMGISAHAQIYHGNDTGGSRPLSGPDRAEAPPVPAPPFPPPPQHHPPPT